jgi:hypothetical protein
MHQFSIYPDDDGIITCIGLISPHCSEIAISDAQGKMQFFSCDITGGASNENLSELCFSTHCHNADDLLTPCFDLDGLHGGPEEDCFCGVDTLHLHAHMHDPKICGDGHMMNTSESGDLESQLMLLARLTLHPIQAPTNGDV